MQEVRVGTILGNSRGVSISFDSDGRFGIRVDEYADAVTGYMVQSSNDEFSHCSWRNYLRKANTCLGGSTPASTRV